MKCCCNRVEIIFAFTQKQGDSCCHAYQTTHRARWKVRAEKEASHPLLGSNFRRCHKGNQEVCPKGYGNN